MAVFLFDLDGTLADSSAPILRSLNHALAEHRLGPVEPTDLRHHIGPPLAESLHTLLTSRGEDPAMVSSLIDAYRADYVTSSLDLTVCYPGVDEMLDRLVGEVTLGVVTSKPRRFAVPILRALGFSELMAVIEGPRSGESEPKATTLARAIDQLGAPGGVRMIGDRRHDIAAGRAVGVLTVGVTWGFGTIDELTAAGADALVHHPDDIEAPRADR